MRLPVFAVGDDKKIRGRGQGRERKGKVRKVTITLYMS